MAHPQSAIIDFSKYQEEDLGPAVDIIISQLTTNAGTFTALPVTVAILTSQKGTYTTILGKPDYAGKAADLAAARTPLEKTLHDNGIYVNTVANHDLAILAKSGYPLTKLAGPVGPLSKTTLKIKSTENAGEFSYDIDGAPGADGYIICLTLTTNTETDFHKWQWVWCPKTRGLISSLESSKRYKLVSVGVGTSPVLTFSDPIERTTQ